MIKKLERSSGSVFGLEICGKETGENLEQIKPLLGELLMEHEKVNILILLTDFTGWDLKGFFGEIRLGLKFYNRMNKIAIVGDKKWEELLVKIDAPFEKAEERFFYLNDLEKAWEWVEENSP
jgi:hypothetical protein